MHFKFSSLCALLCVISLYFCSTAQESPKTQRDFTVRVSIEMTRFDRAAFAHGRGILFSPDQRFFVLVTSRGLLTSDETESRLLIFRVAELETWLESNQSSRAPEPRVAATVRAIPRADAESAYGPVITKVHWSTDSSAIYFLGESSEGCRQIYRADLPSAALHALTPADRDVHAFKVVANSIVYRSASPRKFDTRQRLAADAMDANGIPLQALLFPDDPNSNLRFYDDLWMYREGYEKQIVDADGHPLRLWNVYPDSAWDGLSISANGRFAIVLVPVTEIPHSWESYEPGEARLKINATDPNLTSEFNELRPSQYALVDLEDGRLSPLGAPLGWTMGSGGDPDVKWSPTGKKVLLANTYLPSGEEDLGHKKVCAIAVFEIDPARSSCLPSLNQRSDLTQMFFSDSEEDTIASDSHHGFVRFHYDNGHWLPTPVTQEKMRGTTAEKAEGSGSLSGNLSIELKQSLNAPPVLWAKDVKFMEGRILWDPNPQLKDIALGEASELNWKDSKGNEWQGGLVLPPNYVKGQRIPLVIQTHGFVQEFLTDGIISTAFAARPLAAAGMAVLQVTDRGPKVYPSEAADNYLGFEAAVEKLAAEGIIDPRKVGIIGFSRTCYYVESALIAHPQRFAAATIADGTDESYVQELLFRSVGANGNEGQAIYGSTPFGPGLANWVKAAPGFHLDQVRTPLRIEAIGPTSLVAEWEIYASLFRQAKPVDLIYIPDGQHILQKPLERVASQQGNVDWFRFWLQGYEDPDPVKADQYKRWRLLKRLQEASEEKGAEH